MENRSFKKLKNLDVLLKNLRESCDFSKDKEHFEKLKLALEQDNYEVAYNISLNKIKEGFFKSKYQTILQDILPHTYLINNTDKNDRIARLISAIQTTDTNDKEFKKVKDVLQTGSSIIIDSTLSDGSIHKYQLSCSSALEAAFKIKNKELIEFLISQGATLDSITNKQDMTEQGDSALHIACELKLYDLVARLLDEINPNIKKKNNMTPLLIACKDNDKDLAILLLNRGANPHDAYILKSGEGVTPFLIALQNGNVKLAEIIVKNFNYQPKPIDFIAAKKLSKDSDLYDYLKKDIRNRRHEIINVGPISLHNKPDKPIDEKLNSIFEHLYVENKTLGNEIRKDMKYIYNNKNEILKPLLDLISLGTQGFHISNNPVNKKLKILVTNKNSIHDIVEVETYNEHNQNRGLFKGKNTIYAAGAGGNLDLALATIFHEMQHFADKQIFGNQYPYRDSHYEWFNKIKVDLKNKSVKKSTSLDKPPTTDDEIIYNRIAYVFNSYDSSQHNGEILVKVPEILGLLGLKDGYKWLQQNEPELLRYYETVFIPECKAYIENTMKKKQAVNEEIFPNTPKTNKI
jgi:ankyrin repeat protein